jgi:hypothetical protein
MVNLTQKALSQGSIPASALSTYSGLGVMLIDMQKSFIFGKSDTLFFDDEAMLYRTHTDIIRKLCIDNYVPLINVIYEGSGMVSPIIMEEIKKVPILYPYVKSSPNAFGGKSRLASTLKKMNIDTLLMMGVYASACVYDSATTAVKKDFNVVTANDIIADCIRLKLKSKDKREGEFVENGVKYYRSYTEFLDTLNFNGF